MPELLFEDHFESFWAPYEKCFRPRRIGISQFDLLISAEQHSDCYLRLQPGQMTTEASMRAGAEGEMSIVFSLDVESIRIGKLDRITIGGSNQDDDGLTRFHRLPEEFESGRYYSRDSLNGTLESEDFFHCAAH